MHVQNNAEKPSTLQIRACPAAEAGREPGTGAEARRKLRRSPARHRSAARAGVRFEGKLTFAGTVRIDASFVARSSPMTSWWWAMPPVIDANITCGTIVVHGEVNGTSRRRPASRSAAPAKVRGDLETPSLVIEKGAFFQGASRMDPAAKAARAKTAA